jgi:hypothetical protein
LSGISPYVTISHKKTARKGESYMDENGQAHSSGAVPTSRRVNGKKRVAFIKKLSPRQIIIGVVAVTVIVVATLIGALTYQSTMGANIDGSKFQAVFFTNGQVYFGKLQTLNGNYMKLTNVFYLQTKAAEVSGNPQVTSAQDTNDVQLIKLGNEIHGPVDEMIISKDQILFFENLKDNGKVTQSIDKYLNK